MPYQFYWKFPGCCVSDGLPKWFLAPEAEDVVPQEQFENWREMLGSCANDTKQVAPQIFFWARSHIPCREFLRFKTLSSKLSCLHAQVTRCLATQKDLCIHLHLMAAWKIFLLSSKATDLWLLFLALFLFLIPFSWPEKMGWQNFGTLRVCFGGIHHQWLLEWNSFCRATLPFFLFPCLELY